LEETEPTLKQLTEPMAAAVYDVERYLDGGLEEDLKVNYLRCGDRRITSKPLLRFDYLREIRERCPFDLDDPSAVLDEKR